MKTLLFPFNYNGTGHQLEMMQVSGSTEIRFVFGDEHAVAILDFYIAKTETTQALWNFIMEEDGSRFLYKGDQQPAEHVSWDDCQSLTAQLPLLDTGMLIAEIELKPQIQPHEN